VGRSLPAAARRPADCGRPDRDLPPRPERGVPPGLLDRGRRRRVLRDAARAASGLPRARELQVPLRALGDRAADPPGAAAFRHDDQRRAPVGEARAAPVPARRAGEDRADRLPRGVSARESARCLPRAA
jgi:hypothetical protein